MVKKEDNFRDRLPWLTNVGKGGSGNGVISIK